MIAPDAGGGLVGAGSEEAQRTPVRIGRGLAVAGELSL